MNTNPSELAQSIAEGCNRAGLSVGISIPSLGVREIGHYGHLSDFIGAPEFCTTTFSDVASVTKALAALCALKFVQRGVVGIDEKISMLLGSEELEQHHVSLRHLMTYGLRFQFERNPKESTDPSDLKRLFQTAKLKETPGMAHRYSNVTGWFLGEVIRRLSGKTFDRVMGEEVFSPLGLNGTVFAHRLNGHKTPVVSVQDPSGGIEHIHGRPSDENTCVLYPEPTAIAGVFMTTSDALVVAEMLMQNGVAREGEQFLPKYLMDEVFTNQWEGKTTDRFGLGFCMQPSNWRPGEFSPAARKALQQVIFFRGSSGFTVWASRRPQFALVFAPGPFKTNDLFEIGESELKLRYHLGQGDLVRDLLNALS